MRIYAVGDIHGQLELLRAAHRRIEADGGRDARVVHVGDLVDRGPDSAGVIAYLLAGRAAGRDWQVLLGNHDRMMLRFLRDPAWIDPGLAKPLHWADHSGLGAAATLASYGVDVNQPRATLHRAALHAVPKKHLQFLAGLPLWLLTPRALFVHAGVRPGVDMQAQTEDDLVWIRRPFLDSADDHGVLVVHGHTPIDRVAHLGNRLAIDTGAAYGGPLSVVAIEPDGSVMLLTDGGREPVQPFSPQGCAGQEK